MISSLDLYRIFYYVGKYKNITHAATTLFISQSTVSRCIRNLEDELGCRLLDRSQRGVEFTAEGSLLYKYVSSACETFITGEEKLKSMQDIGSGTIRIGVNDFAFQTVVLPLIRDFRRDYPGVRLEVTYVSSDLDSAALDQLEDGSLSFLCMSLHGPVPKTDLIYEAICGFQDVVVAGEEYRHLLDRPQTLSGLLRSCPFVAQTGKDSFFDKVRSDRQIEADAAFRVNTVSMFLPMVSQGLCLAVIPNTYLVENSNVFEIPVTDPLPERSIWVISSKSSLHSSAQDELIRRIRRFSRRPSFQIP